ncbi:MAG: ABC transporter permease [Actinomycetota bacterium]
MSAAPTDRGTWRLVARRDFWVRLRERSFLVSTLLNVTVISILVLARAYGGGGGAPSFDLGVVGATTVADAAARLGQQAHVQVRVRTFADAMTAEQAVRDGTVGAALVNGQLIGDTSVNPNLLQLVEGGARNVALQDLLDRYHVPETARAPASDPSPVPVAVLQEGAQDRTANAEIAFIGVILLYGQLFGYGIWVASGVIEEKASRVVEMLLSAIRPKQLLAGKIVGIGVLGLGQMVVIASCAIALATVTHAIDVPGSAIDAALLDFGWFLLGFAFYASLFAVAGSLVTRMEELQNVIVPINLTILVSFFISVSALQDPNGLLPTIASILPTSSALAMPVRIVLGAAPGWQIALALVLLVGSTVLLVPLSARLYSGAVLRTGARVKIRDAWRASAS